MPNLVAGAKDGQGRCRDRPRLTGDRRALITGSDVSYLADLRAFRALPSGFGLHHGDRGVAGRLGEHAHRGLGGAIGWAGTAGARTCTTAIGWAAGAEADAASGTSPSNAAAAGAPAAGDTTAVAPCAERPQRPQSHDTHLLGRRRHLRRTDDAGHMVDRRSLAHAGNSVAGIANEIGDMLTAVF
ncbi:MAG TPA: hypothetical protein VE197_22250, partial [Mycobacterium sp.]|nr:hypothetical protein [Mycobacterium sp.]